MLFPDLNVLVALAWPNHQFHRAAVARMNREKDPWATCAITQLGFIRLSSTAGVVGRQITPAEARQLLIQLTSHARHRYLENTPDPRDEAVGRYMANIYGHRQVNDAYLVAIASAHSARLVTFDTRIAAFAGTDAVDVLEAM